MQEATTDYDVGYAMGLIVGEGSFTGDAVAPAVMVKMSADREPLEHLLKVFGGNLFGPYVPEPPRMPYGSWILRGTPLRRAIALFDARLPRSRKRLQYEAWRRRWSGWLDSDQGFHRRLSHGTIVRYEGPGVYAGEKVERRVRAKQTGGRIKALRGQLT